MNGEKRGIASASRLVEFEGKKYTIGTIVMSNFGELGNLRIDGHRLYKMKNGKGSIIMMIGMALPLSDRALRRVPASVLAE